MLSNSSSPSFFLHIIIASILLVFVFMSSHMSHQLSILSNAGKIASSKYQSQPENAPASNIPKSFEYSDQDSRNSNLQPSNRFGRMVEDYTQTSNNTDSNNQSDSVGLIPIVEIGSSNDKIPASRIIVCNDGPKILLFENGDVVTCFPSWQWQEKLWSDIKPSVYYYPFILANIIIFVIGTTGNVFVCLSVYRNHTLRNVTNYFIVNLALADFLVILICLPPTVIWDLTLTWFFGTFACKMVMYLQDVSVSVSVLTLTAISIDRYYAICYPLRFKSNLTKAKKIIAIIWLISFLIMSPDLIYLTTRQSKELYESGLDTVLYSDCNYNWSLQSSRIFQFEKTILLYFIPFLLMVVAHYNINKVLKVAQPNEMISIPDRGKQHRSFTRNYHHNSTNDNNKPQHHQPIDHLSGGHNNNGRRAKKFMNKTSHAINHKEQPACETTIPVLCVQHNSTDTIEEQHQQQTPLLAQSENELHHRHDDSVSSMAQINCSTNDEYNLSAPSATMNTTNRHDDTSPSQVELNSAQKATNCNRFITRDHTGIKQQRCEQASSTQTSAHDNTGERSGNGLKDSKKDSHSITLRQQRNHSTIQSNGTTNTITDPSPSVDRSEIDPINFHRDSSLHHQQINSQLKTGGNYLVSDPNVPADQIASIDKSDRSKYDDNNDDDRAGQVSWHLLSSVDGEKKEKIASGRTRTRTDQCYSCAPSTQTNIDMRCGISSERCAPKAVKEREHKPNESSKKTQTRLLNPTTNALSDQRIDRMIHVNDNDDENELAASEYQIIGEHSCNKTANGEAVCDTKAMDNERNAELVCINQLVCSNCLITPMARSDGSEINDAPNSITIDLGSTLEPKSPANKESASSFGSSSSYDTIKLNNINEKIKRRESSNSSTSILCCSGFCRSCSKGISQTSSTVNARTMNTPNSYVNNKSAQRLKQTAMESHSANCNPSVDGVFCGDNRTILNKGDTSCREAAFSSLSASSGDTSLSTADTDDNGVNQLADKNVTVAYLLHNDDDVVAPRHTNSITEQSRVLPKRMTYRQHHNQLTGEKGSTMSVSVINSDARDAPIEPSIACDSPIAEKLLSEHDFRANTDGTNVDVLSQTTKERADVSNVHDLERGGSNFYVKNRCSTIKGIEPHDSRIISVHHKRLPASLSSNKSVDLDESIFKYCSKQSLDNHDGDTNIIKIGNGSSLQIIVTDEDREKNGAPVTEFVSSSDLNDTSQPKISAQEADSNYVKESASKQLFDLRGRSVSGHEPYELTRIKQHENMPEKSSNNPVETEKSCIYDDDTEVDYQDEHKNGVDNLVVRHEKNSRTMTIKQAKKPSTINPNHSKGSPYNVQESHNTNYSTRKSVNLTDLLKKNIPIKGNDEENFSTSRDDYINSSLHKHDLCNLATNSRSLDGANIECSSFDPLRQPLGNIGCNLESEQHDNGYNYHEANPLRKVGTKPKKIVGKTSLVTRASTSEEELSSCKGDISENCKKTQYNVRVAAQELATRSLCDLKSCDKSVAQASDCQGCHNLNNTSVIIPGLLRPDISASNLNRDNEGKVVKSHLRSNSIATSRLAVDEATDTSAFLGSTSNIGSILASMVPSINMHNKSKIQSRQKAAKMLMAIVIIFGVCFLPVHLINFLRHIVDDIPQTEITSTISMLSHCFCYLNSAINPIIYNYMNSVFRQEFKRFLSCLWCSSKNKSIRPTRPTNMKTRECAKTGTITKDGKLANRNSKPIQTSTFNHARQLSCLTNNFHDDCYNEHIQAMTSTTSARSCLNNRKNTDCTTLSSDLSEMNKVKSMEV